MDYVVSSGILPDVTLNTGDTMEVFSTGIAVSTTVEAGGTQTVYSGGVVSETTVSGGVLNVSGGGTSYDVSAVNFGVVSVFNGGITSGSQIYGNDTVEAVNSGGKSYFTTVGYEAGFSIVDGAVASGTVVNGGIEYVFGGTSYDTTGSAGAIIVEGNGVTSGSVLYGSVAENVSSGGKTYFTTINSGASQSIISGGVSEYRTTVNKGGSDDVDGLSTSATINDGLQGVHGSAFYTLIENGGIQESFGSSTSATVVNGGVEDVGHAYDTNVEYRGILNVEVQSVDAMLTSGGQENVFGRGTASGTVLKPGGDALIGSGGTDYESKINFGAAETVLSLGYSDSAHVASGGLLAVTNGGSAFGTVFAKGSYLVVAPGGKVSGTLGAPTLVTKGVVAQSPLAGPKDYTSPAKNIKIAATGSAFVLPSGTAISATDAGLMTVYSGGTADFTKVNGSLTVLSGGVESGALIVNGGSETVSGATTYFDTVGSGGTEVVSAAVDVSGHAVGGISSVTIAGGTLNITNGAKLMGAVTFNGYGGVFEDGSTVVPTNIFSGFVVSDEIVLPSSIPYNSGATVSVSTPGKVEIKSGDHGYVLNIAGATKADTFTFSSGSILTETASPATMTFLRPPAPAVSAETTNWFDASRPAVMVIQPTVVITSVIGAQTTFGCLNKECAPSAFALTSPVVSHSG